MTREEALELYMSVRYNLPNSKLKEAVDVAFDCLKEHASDKRLEEEA